MDGETYDRRSRRRTRAGLWLLFVTVSLAFPLSMDFPGSSSRLPWLILPALVFVAGHRWMAEVGGVPVLTYHSVSVERDWLPWALGTSVTPETFERQMKTLKAIGCNVVSTPELVNARKAGEPLPSKPVVIHFDDGYLDNWTAAYPIIRRHGLSATLFVSTDFIEDGKETRPNLDDVGAGKRSQESLEWSGYLNWAELRAMDSSGLIDVQAHGTDHGRVRTGPRMVDRLTPGNWRSHAWVQWAQMNGNKSQWFRHSEPPLVPVGSPVYESGPALASRSWRDGGLESEAEYEARVRSVLETSRAALEAALQKKVMIFCWPYNRATPAARRIAEETGFLASTGGHGENRPEEDPTVISRITVHEGTLGLHWSWLDCFMFKAKVHMCHGNYYWYLPVLAIRLLGHVTKPLIRRGR